MIEMTTMTTMTAAERSTSQVGMTTVTTKIVTGQERKRKRTAIVTVTGQSHGLGRVRNDVTGLVRKNGTDVIGTAMMTAVAAAAVATATMKNGVAGTEKTAVAVNAMTKMAVAATGG